MTILTLFVDSTKPIKYSHRGRFEVDGVMIEVVASVDVETRRLLDIRWTAESVTPEQRQMIDDRLSAVIGSVIPESGDVGGFGGLVGWEAF
ncbi:hypothetical protein EBZ35_06910 [bacterium]|nr:hypothetical protein [bacterium]